ncbi:MAG: Holliday junction branch migration protein RuvA [Oscillospiraceae bacterium]|jgi:Holliday junction DNA helicase RuvA|nr:Holliday junction branch migration protein RuvA [Oscillospiraceae bacterium]
MFYSLTGAVVHVEETMLAVECGGVAFACQSTANTLREVRPGERITLFTYLSVREDALELFGFASRTELTCFRQLIAVTGVGPKAALAVLSVFTPEQLAFCVASGDAKSITRAQGVGKKLAERMILELKDKLQAYPSPGGRTRGAEAFSGNAFALPDSEALEALLALGYDQSEALLALKGLDESLDTPAKIKLALRQLTTAP